MRGPHPRLKPGSCTVLIVDDGFQLHKAFYANEYGRRIAGAWVIDNDGQVAEHDADEKAVLGAGDHGDRVAELVLSIAPHADLHLVHRKCGMDLHKGIYQLMVKLNSEIGDTPLVVNLSFGTNLGAHDGTSAMEMDIEHHVIESRADSIRLIVKSAGNEGTSAIHFCDKRLVGKGGLALEVKVDGSVSERLSLWHRWDSLIQYQVEHPTGARTPVYYRRFSRDSWDRVVYTLQGDGVSMNWQAHKNAQCELQVQLEGKGNQKLSSGTWKIWFTPARESRDEEALEIRGWINRTRGRKAKFVNSSAAGTITIPGTSLRVLAVTGTGFADSSRGPSYSVVNAEKPEVALPAFSLHEGLLKQGTSFAAPRLTGCLALLLSTVTVSTVDDVHEILRESCIPGSAQLAYGELDYGRFSTALARRMRANSGVPSPGSGPGEVGTAPNLGSVQP